MNAKTGNIFEADAEGFRSQQIGRPAAHLVRELVQNALDESGVMNLDVLVTYHGPRRGTTVKVTDDAPAGVADPKLIFTIWLSNKEDSPTKRGRMGRGLKELVSVCDETIIRSVGMDALKFERFQGGRWERSVKPKLGRPERGTEVTAFCRSWGEKAAKSIVEFLRRVRAPGSITMRVGYRDEKALEQACAEPLRPLEQVRPFIATEKYEMVLSTVMFESTDGERVERERQRNCVVECFVPPAGESAYVYEMGIPVEECDSPVSIDVGQRVILRERRDTLTEAYKRKLFAKVLSARLAAGNVSTEQLRDRSTLIAAESYADLSYDAKCKIAKVWTEGKPFAADPKTRAIATGHHVEVVNLRSLPEQIRDIVRSYGTDVKSVLEQRKAEFCPVVGTMTAQQAKLVQAWEWIAKGIGRQCTVQVRKGTPGAIADFDRNTRVLSLYVEALDKKFFDAPFGGGQLGLLIHELSHWSPREDEHGSAFTYDTEDVGGAVAAFLLRNAEQARLMES